MKQLFHSGLKSYGRTTAGLLLLFLLTEKVSGQELPAEPKNLIQTSIENWNFAYGTNVRAIDWVYEGVISNNAKLKQAIDEITSPANAWLPDGNVDKPAEMTARRIADVPAITKMQIADWASKIREMIRKQMHMVRVKWMKGTQSFTSLCITDDNTIVYDNMFSNTVMIEHHSRCLDYRIGWIWQRNYANMTRGSITTDLTVRCVNGVATCGNACTANFSLGEAKVFCTVTKTGPCCTLAWTYGWATGFGTVTITPTGVVLINQPLGSKGSGADFCTGCCPPSGTGYAIPATPGSPEGGFIRDIDTLPPQQVRTISVKTISGEVIDVKVPNNIRPGDRITGSVVPKNQSSTLQGAVVDVENNKTDVKDKLFKFLVPAGAASIPFILRDNNGAELARTEIPVNTHHLPIAGNNVTVSPQQIQMPPEHSPGNFAPMNYCQPGEPLTINGFFDGNAANTNVSINNIPCEVLTESFRGSFAQVPLDLPAGRASLTIQEGGVTQTMAIQVITTNLSANKTVVQKGTTAKVTATVSGLENLDLNNNNFKIELTNGSPGIIQFREANTTTIIRDINNSNVKNGTFTFTTDISGTATGSYTVGSNVTSTTCIDCWKKYKDCLANCEAEEKKCYDACDKGNKGIGCYLACSAAARLCEAACWTDYLNCVRQKLGY